MNCNDFSCGNARAGTYSPDQCRKCWAAANHPDVAKGLGRLLAAPLAPSAVTPQMRAAAMLAPPPCIRRGSLTGETRACKTCAGVVLVPLSHCAKHGKCHATAGKVVDGAPQCQTCPDATAQIVPGVVDPLPGPFRGPHRADADRHAAALQQLAGMDFTPPAMRGAGIVTCGGGRYWPGVVVMVRLLRRMGCTLPVEVWYRGLCESVDARDVSGMNVTLIDADAHADRTGMQRIPRGRQSLGGWSSKLYAIAHTSFKRCIFIDADAYFASDPTPLLTLGVEHGFACWDEPTTNNVDWKAVGYPNGKPPNAPPSIQGGQLAIDRRRLWREIVLTQWICQHEDFYWPERGAKPLFGDQDAWRLAFQTTGFRPHVIAASEFRAGWGYVCWMGGVEIIHHRAFSKLIPTKLAGEAAALAEYASYLGADEPAGWLTGEEARALRDVSRGKLVLEWGRYHGKSTAVLAAVADHVWSVDTLPAGLALPHLTRLGVENRATLVTGDYTDAATLPPWTPHVVYVDGAHDAASVVRDLDAAARVVSAAGSITLHDYGDANARAVKPAADEWAPRAGWKLTDTAGTLAVFKRDVWGN